MDAHPNAVHPSLPVSPMSSGTIPQNFLQISPRRNYFV